MRIVRGHNRIVGEHNRIVGEQQTINLWYAKKQNAPDPENRADAS